MRKKAKWIIMVFQMLIGIWICSQMVLAEETPKTMRVGYIEQCDFIKEENGECTGFAVDYLNLIAEDTGWQYTFTGTTWDECQELLATGQVDMLCISQKDRAWQEQFIYSKASLGFEYFLIYSREDKEVFYDEYEALNGCKIGMLLDAHESFEFDEMTKQQNIVAEKVLFNSVEEMKAALQNDSIDFFVTGSFDAHDDLKLIARFGSESIFCIMEKENAELMEQYDKALEAVKIQKPDTAAWILQKYFKNEFYSCVPLFTKEEHDFIKDAKPVHISLRTGVEPLCYLEDGQCEGIFSELIELLSKESSLEFEIVPEMEAKTGEELLRGMVEKDCLLVLPKSAIQNLKLENVIVGTTLMNSRLTYVKRRDAIADEGRNDYKFAIMKDMDYLVALLEKDSADYEILLFDSTEECLQAVLDGEADIAVQDSYMLRYMLQKPIYAEKLATCPGEEYAIELCFVAPKDKKLLMQVINKTIDQMGEKEVETLIAKALLTKTYNFGISDWFYKYKRSVIIICVLLLLGAVVYSMLLRKMTALSVQKKEYEQLRHKVQLDDITGVYNRASFYKKAKEMIDAADEGMCIVMMDISNFKVVNDLYGMDIGDKLLRYMAKQLSNLCEERNAIVGRFTGDHFYMCLSERDFQEIEFPRRYKTFLQEMEITVSYGVFKVEEKKSVPVNIMCDRANLAVHDEERKGVEYIRFYSDEERSRIILQQEIENDMEKALDGRQFSVFIQPKYDINEGRIVGGEALVRWKHPQKGMISPGIFIDIFEKNGFIIRLDYYVWEETCRLLAALKKQGIEGYPISINVSRAHFYGSDLQYKLEELIKKYELQPSELELEITESICVDDSGMIYKKIRKLQEIGFKVAMDDFGSGYSSLNMLKEMPLDIIKMDLKFLDGGENEEKSRNILQTLIMLAQSMQLFVVVEGVETKEQVEFLKKIGNHHVQGYYFSKPIESEAYENMLKSAID